MVALSLTLKYALNTTPEINKIQHYPISLNRTTQCLLSEFEFRHKIHLNESYYAQIPKNTKHNTSNFLPISTMPLQKT